MKATKLFILMTLMIIGLTFSSCSDDDKDDDNNGTTFTFGTKNVFTGNLLESIDHCTYKYNADGLLTELIDNTYSYETKTTLEYKKTSNKVSSVLMTTVGSENLNENTTIVYEIGANGFATNASVVYTDEDGTEKYYIAFGYNTDGQLTSVKRTGSWVDNNIFSYVNGNIATLVHTDEEGGNFVHSIKYTSEAYPEGIKNVGGTMLFEDTFGLKLGGVETAYYVGILGKGTKYLPLERHETYNDDYLGASKGYKKYFTWVTDSKGYVNGFSIIDGSYTNDKNLAWY